MKNSWKLLLVMVLTAAVLLGCGAQNVEVTEPEKEGNPFATEAVVYPYDFTSEDFFFVRLCLCGVSDGVSFKCAM